MRFGIFLAPFHAVEENPTNAIERDFELVEHLDNLGYDEAWIGEHHSGGFEIIASPEVFKFIINAGMISPKASNSFMPIGSVNRIELAITPTIGTASVPIPETDAGKT